MSEEPAAPVTVAPPPADQPAAGAAAPAPSSSPAAPDGTAGSSKEPFWREAWRERIAGNDEQELKQLRRYASPEGIWRKARELEKRLSSGEFRRSKPDGDTPEAIAEWRKEIGVPDTPEAYLHALPRDIEVGNEDVPTLNRIFNRAHEKGVGTEEITEIVREYYASRREAEEAQYANDAEHKRKTEDELYREWGPERRANLNGIATMLDQYAAPEVKEALFGARTADGRLLGDDPKTLKFLASLAREVCPDGFITLTGDPAFNGGLVKVEDEIRKIEVSMQDTHGRDPNGYWKNEKMQKQYADLLEARERMQRRSR